MAQISTKTNLKGCVDSRIGGRSENQDTCGYADTPLGLLIVVCDGMGGGPGGKIASSVAVDAIIQVVRSEPATSNPKKVLAEAVIAAHQALLQIVTEKPVLLGLGSTATALLINDRSAVVAHVGDSRIYQFRRKAKKFRTFDHSVVFELVKKGTLTEEQARLSPQSNVITRALGHGEQLSPDIAELPYERGDRFMLCTDGVWGSMPEKELIEIAAGTSNLDGALESLFIQVEENGVNNGNTHDNYSAALIETTKNSILKEKMSTKTRKILFALIIICGISIILNAVQIATSAKTKFAAENAIDSLKIIRAQQQQADSTIKVLNDSVKSLRAQLTKASDSASRSDERAKIEAERREKAEQEKLDAQEKAKEAERAAKEAQEQITVNTEKRNVINELNTIRAKVEGLSKNNKNKNVALKDLEKRVDGLKTRLTKYGASVTQMQKFIKGMKQNDKSAYQNMVKEVEALKRKIQNHK